MTSTPVRHVIEPDLDRLADAFSRDHPPVWTCSAGDTLVVRTLDSSGHLSRQRTPGESQPVAFPSRRGHS
jgi:hypothetical protein